MTTTAANQDACFDDVSGLDCTALDCKTQKEGRYVQRRERAGDAALDVRDGMIHELLHQTRAHAANR